MLHQMCLEKQCSMMALMVTTVAIILSRRHNKASVGTGVVKLSLESASSLVTSHVTLQDVWRLRELGAVWPGWGLGV